MYIYTYTQIYYALTDYTWTQLCTSYICIYTYLYMDMCVYINMYVYIYVYIYAHIYIYIYISVHIYGRTVRRLPM